MHQVRNSCKYVAWKDRQAFSAELRLIYGAVNKDAAYHALENFKENWSGKYGYAIASWENNWEALTNFFDFPVEIRKIIYTTNVIESLNSGIRKFTRSKNLFPDDLAAIKAVYLSIMNIQKKWTKPIQEWGRIVNQFSIIFETRCEL